MANQSHVEILDKGIDFWNKWRQNNPYIIPDLSGEEFVAEDFTGVDFSNANLCETDLRKAQMPRANLKKSIIRDAHLNEANLAEADLSGAELYCSWLNYANLCGANLNNADLTCSDLSDADLTNAKIKGADLYWSRLVRTKLNGANLSNSRIFGVSAWQVVTDENTMQRDLIITQPGERVITVDDLEMAQFIYLLLNNRNIRRVIDAVTSKVVLILGRFSDTRKPVLDSIKNELRNLNYLPILFDFERSKNRDLAETVSTLAHMARFIIADITDAKSICAELELIVPQLLSVPVIPLILDSDYEFGLFERIRRFDSVLEPYRYENQTQLINFFEEKVVNPAKEKADDLNRDLHKIRNSSV